MEERPVNQMLDILAFDQTMHSAQLQDMFSSVHIVKDYGLEFQDPAAFYSCKATEHVESTDFFPEVCLILCIQLMELK